MQAKFTNWLQTQARQGCDIWQYQETVSKRLAAWAALNMFLGVWFQQRRNKTLRGVGMQSISWGAINALIAIFGNTAATIRRNGKDDPFAAEVVQKEHRNLLLALWINAGLDVLYIIGGGALIVTRGSKDRLARGNGWGIIIQGTFLFVFDVIHALIMSNNTKETQS